MNDLLKQELLERTQWLRWLGATVALVLVFGFAYWARGAEPTIEDTRPPPRAFFAVMQCDELVSGWVITQDGKAFRTDAMHHPETTAEYAAFLNWAQKAVTLDVYTIPCANTVAGGKVRSKQPS